MTSLPPCPVCGMPVPDGTGVEIERLGRMLRFCTEFCEGQVLRNPRAYETVAGVPARTLDWADARIAYFSMEIALESSIPTYSGGLGVLAGDALRSSADLAVPLVAVSLVHRKGYLKQEISASGQVEHEDPWEPETRLLRLDPVVTVELERRIVHVRAWRYDVVGSSGFVVPVVLLDTACPENDPVDRSLSERLYGGDDRYRLKQEAILGIGGVRMLRALGCERLQTFHLNEGHAALAPLELLRFESADGEWDFRSVRRRTVFTTHTPVPAGHDRFGDDLVRRVLGEFVPAPVFHMLGGDGSVNMTELALNLSHYVNGVALRHREVSSELFPHREIHQITNGIHSRTWTADPFKHLFDRHIPGWRSDPSMLHNATALPAGEVWSAHERAKSALLRTITERTGRELSVDAFTIGFARRVTAYKRAELVLQDPVRLRRLAAARPLQLIFAGKAHPADEPGKAAIRKILTTAEELEGDVPIVYVADYDMDLAALLVAGSDLWLNTPLPPMEASGTSGMKAAHNGVPSLSVVDGWWREGWIEGVTGWSTGGAEPEDGPEAERKHADELYDKLESTILPLFCDDREGWTRMMTQVIALNASFFNADRMVRQYVEHAYDTGRSEPSVPPRS